jgi:murein DD-endopeptidase MepM/ murein hydrolase activator NlpD
MKRVASCLAVLTALSSTGVYAKTASIRCTSHREVIRSGDNAMQLALRSGVDANHFAAWLKKADPATRQALKHMRPGDAFNVCVAPSGDALVSLHITRDEAGRKLAAQPSDQSTGTSSGLFAKVTGDATTTARPAPEKQPVPAATSDVASSARLLITPLAPGHLLGDELTRLLGHRPVVAAAVAYARDKWHVVERLPKNSHCTLALIPESKSGSRVQLAYIQFEYQGRTDRIYHYVDSTGRDFIVAAHGQSYRVMDPVRPVSDAHISSGWGWRTQPVLGGDEFHLGVDYAAPRGTPVKATMDGVVDMSEWRGEYGRMIEVKHAKGLSTRYAHLSAFAANIHLGSRVHRGDVIGYVGSTGLSTGPHLYYEVWDHGVRINPLVHQSWMVLANLDSHERERFGEYVNSIMAAP